LIIIGLSLNIIGVIILYLNGPPISPILPDGSELLWMDDGPEKKKQKAEIAKNKIKLSKQGLIVIIIGFIYQLIGLISK
jgi:hypothetical protein